MSSFQRAAFDIDKFDMVTQEMIDRDQVYQQLVYNDFTLGFMQKHGMVKTGVTMADKLQWRYAKEKPDSSVWASEWQTFTLQGKNRHDTAEITPSDLVGQITLSQKQLNRNMKMPEKIFDLMEEEISDRTKEMREQLNTDIFNDEAVGDRIQGFRRIVQLDRTWAGVNSTTYPFWDAKVYSTGYASRTYTNLSSAAHANNVRRTLLTVKKIMEAQKVSWKNYIIIGTQQFQMAYEDLVQDFLTVNYGDHKMVDLDTDTVKFRGVPIYSDPDCPTDATYSYAYLLNTKDMKLVFSKQYGKSKSKGLFLWDGWAKNSPHQRSYSGLMVASCALAARTPRLHMAILCDPNVGVVTE